ncbi:phage antirepressor [Pseudomonas sp. LFM046]|uniref:phage antirepressor n=1 Tax=Pseudomonas sp. LFM046 TaxID=1608357 RepID=UPI000A9CFE2F|nr:phage antirepressor [Pseudomonas sp. LFM046]
MSTTFYETRHFFRHGRLLGVSANVRLNDGLDADQWRTGLLKCGRGLVEEEMMISESGSYDLLLRRFYHPENRNLRRWLTHEVIPAPWGTSGESPAIESMGFAGSTHPTSEVGALP